MEIVEKTNNRLVFTVNNLNAISYTYCALLITGTLIVIAFCVIIYGLPGLWGTVGLLILDMIVFVEMLKTYTITIDRNGDNLMVTENNRLVYSSDYPIQEIESIKSEVDIGYGRLNSTSSLIIKLKNTHTERVVYKVVIYFSHTFCHRYLYKHTSKDR